MRLLIITQGVDKRDPVLGFFHRWIEEFAKHVEKVTVICLFEGEHSLPESVKVLSLGKEQGHSRIKYIVRFFRYIWRERMQYDAVFVHMNPEYIVLGGMIWRVMGKRIALWYNHKKGGMRARIAATFADIIFYTSPDAFMSRFKKAKRMGAGIDTTLFQRRADISRIPRSILSLGRISPVKHIDAIVEALALLDQKGINFTASVYGDPTDVDHEYYERVRRLGKSLETKGKLQFHPGLPNADVPSVMNRFELFINMTPSGSFDKTVLEAMACESFIITCNESFQHIIPDELMVHGNDNNTLAQKILDALSLSAPKKERLGKKIRDHVVKEHEISTTVRKITEIFQHI